MDENIQIRKTRIKLSHFYLPVLLLLCIVGFLFAHDALNAVAYAAIQRDFFHDANEELSQFPLTQYNLTQFGDTFIFLSILTIFIAKAPRSWGSMIIALLSSLFFATILKKLFAIPRPAAAYGTDSFVIIGKTLLGNNSLPSGHSITVFTILTVLLYEFMPKTSRNKFIWVSAVLCIGIIFVSSRVGVGAHYPIDVATGSIIGYICGLIGIYLNDKYQIWNLFNNKKLRPILVVLFIVAIAVLIHKIILDQLVVFFLALISILCSFYKIIKSYVQN